MERCTNKRCCKTHCARHDILEGCGQDYNPNNKFKCPGYLSRFSQSKGANYSIVAERNQYGRIVTKLYRFK